ncbi:coth protein-domain-containing protein [Parasitella parasitica]|nr:coth protein-domain-containing protein [Parasitella parasitica]
MNLLNSFILGLLASTALALEINNIIEYNVVGLLNQSETMGVTVDNATYPLKIRSNDTRILHSGMAPTAKSGYNYVRIYPNNTVVKESFKRAPVIQNTVNEFFNRTWNNYSIAQFPQIYPPLASIKRVTSQLHKEGQIPSIHISGNQTLFDKMHGNSTADLSVMSNVSYVSLNDSLFYQDVEVSLAGRSSRWFPKLSYNLKLDKKDRLYKYRRVKLRALATDPSYIREQLAYDIVKSVGLASSEFSFVRVFMNDQPLGLFGIIETFQDPWLANTFANGSNSYENGYLYQGVFMSPQSAAQGHISDLSYISNATAYGDGQYKIKQEASKGDKVNWEPLQDFTKFISTAPTNQSDSVATWKKHLDTDSFLRSMALEVLLGFADGYFAMADNYYVYQNLKANNYIYIPSDMDLTLGSTMFNLTQMWSGNYSTFPGIETRPLMEKILQVPQFNKQYNELLLNFTNMLINPNKTNDRIDDLVDMLQEDVAWDKTIPRIGSNIFGQIDPTAAGNDTSSILGAVLGSAIPMNMDPATAANMAKRINASIPFMTAVDGPTGYISLAGVKEWISIISQNVTSFYQS